MSSSILMVSQCRADVGAARSAFARIPSVQLVLACTYGEALRALMRDSFGLILCDLSFSNTCWKDLLSQIASLPDPPAFVLMSPAEPQSAWAEALNLGARDVLATPLDKNELVLLLERIFPSLDKAAAAPTLQLHTVAGG